MLAKEAEVVLIFTTAAPEEKVTKFSGRFHL